MVSVRLDLPFQRCDPVVRRMVRFYTCARLLNMLRFDQKAHPAGQISLDRPRCGCDPVGYSVLQKEVAQRQPLFIVCK